MSKASTPSLRVLGAAAVAAVVAGATLFAGQGRHAGLEAHGDLARLLALLGA